MTNNEIRFADISQGTHTFAVVAKDGDGLVDRSEVHFEGEREREFNLCCELILSN